MAIDSGQPTDETPRPADAKPRGLTRGQRWARYGTNVTLAVILAVAATALVILLAHKALRGKARLDMTAGNQFTLSGQTRAMLGGLETEITITDLYPPEVDTGNEALDRRLRRRYETVRDHLRQYEAAAENVTVREVDPTNEAELTAFLQRLRDRFQSERETVDRAIEDFNALREDLETFLRMRSNRIQSLVAEAELSSDLRGGLVGTARRLEGYADAGKNIAEGLVEAKQAVFPQYSGILTSIREYIKEVRAELDRIIEAYRTVRARGEGRLPGPVENLFEEAPDAYEPMLERLDAFVKPLEDVGEFRYETVVNDLLGNWQRPAILVATPNEVQIVPFAAVWTDTDAETPVFTGESAVASAILGLVEETKPVVLFVTAGEPMTAPGSPGFGGMGGRPGGRYSGLAKRLERSNYIVRDWNVAAEATLPQIEGGGRVVLVFMPPSPPNPQRRQPPPSPEAYRPAMKLVEEGKVGAMVMVEPDMGFFQPRPPYTDLFAAFGLVPKLEAVAVQTYPTRQGEVPVPQLDITSFPDHAITAPVAEAVGRVVFPTISPIVSTGQPPAGVETHPIVLLPTRPGVWADTTVLEALRNQAERDPKKDLIPTAENPIPLAVAVTRSRAEGDAEPQRVVFFGDADWASVIGQRIGEQVPGNEELLMSSVLWVSGREHLIEQTPRALEARRIGSVDDSARWAVRIVLIGVLPLAVGAAGLIVLVRRRR